MAKVELDQATHTYRVGGKVISGITGLLRDAGIIKGVDYGSDEALWRGKLIHKALEYLNKGTLNWDTVDNEIEPYIRAYQQFQMDTGFKPRSWENSLYHPQLKYCGTYDVEGPAYNDDHWLVDTKTGLTSLAMSDWVGIQTAAQALLLPNSTKYKRFGLKLTSEGKYNLIRYEDPEDYNAFVAIIALRNWRNKHNE